MKDYFNIKSIIFTIFLFLLSFNLVAQDYAVSTIPDSLKKDANAVIRDYSVQFFQKNRNEGILKVHRVVTVFNKKGESAGNFFSYADKFRTLSAFSGTMRNASGTVIKKIKKSDLTTSSISTDAGTLASDDIHIFYECKSPVYPYTIEYIYEQRYKNGILAYPHFSPVGYNASVEKSGYYLEVPIEQDVRYKMNCEASINENINASTKIYSVALSNVKAIESENYSPSNREVLPLIFFAPVEFCYDSHCGNMSDWKNYGLWINTLLEGRDAIPAGLENKLRELTKDFFTDKEKVKAVYEFLQANTRYVNIAFGIGGYQPLDAETVYKTNFGDCKALTNYMKAMLKSIGIDSRYTLISTEFKNLYEDYPNFNQLNHVILLVPFENDSVWLECTSNITPCGYIHRDIAGHDALVIAEEGGEICRLPSYPDEDNKVTTKLSYSLDSEDGIVGDLHISAHLAKAESPQYYFRSNVRKDLVDYINGTINLGKVAYNEILTSVNKSASLSVHLNTRFKASDFVNKSGSRYFIPVCTVDKGHFNIFKAKTRTLPIEFLRGQTEIDTVVINIPESFVPESLPKALEEKTPYGNFASRVEVKGRQIIYIQRIDLFSGRYDNSDYNDIKDFFNLIYTNSHKKIVLKKEN